MGSLFDKRMQMYKKPGGPGQTFVENACAIDDKLFVYDQAYKKGIIYDWEMNELEEIEFKFGKQKTKEPEAYDIEYWVQFKSGFNPESAYKKYYYKNDGRERFGFYIDVPDYQEGVIEKWLIVGKDDKVAFDRYLVYKCNWCFEWVHNGIYYRQLGVIRDKNDNATNDVKKNRTLGGTSVYDDISIIVPSCQTTNTIVLGKRFILNDNELSPHCYEVVDNKDSISLGVSKIYFVRCLFNNHTDFIGASDDFKKLKFNIKNEIEDLPDGFGGKYHKICNCVDSSINVEEDIEDEVDYSAIELVSSNNTLFINGNEVVIEAKNIGTTSINWHILVDNIEYSIDDLKDYFSINIKDNKMYIKAINKVMAKYIVKVSIYDIGENFYQFVEMEVKL